ncbi:hypothetical protein ECDEC10F_5953 [Escherichia coli DEC10F]|nr:hypothetical protein ECDEC10F_5953 [Escherichia coli DEC10F]
MDTTSLKVEGSIQLGNAHAFDEKFIYPECLGSFYFQFSCFS